MPPVISIQDIDSELEKYPPRLAWDLLMQLNGSPILNGIDAWRACFPMLLEKYRERLFVPIEEQRELTEAMKTVAERPTNSYSYGNGAIHDDRRSQFVLGEERANRTATDRHNKTLHARNLIVLGRALWVSYEGL